MKFSFNFDIAVLITLLTSFLFWCGYWYNYGYVEYFGVTISFSDLSFPYALIDGLLAGIDKFLYMFIFLLFTAFLAGNSGKDGYFILNLIASSAIGLILIAYYLIYGMHKKNKYVYISPYYQSPLLKKNFPKKLRKKPDFSKNQLFVFTKKHLKEQKMDISSIKKDIYGGPEKETGIEKSIAIHLSALVLFILVISILFGSGMSLQNEGKLDAKRNFELNFKKRPAQANELFHVFPKIEEINDSEPKDQNSLSEYLLTNICNKDSCFAVDNNKKTKLVKLENIEILNKYKEPENETKRTSGS